MTRRGVMAALAGSAALGMLEGCSEMFPERFRFRMTVEVETPHGLKTGSGVMEVSAALATFKLPDSHAVDTHFKGEAVAVDLPGGTLFALVGDIGPGNPLAGVAVKSFDPLTGPEAKFVASVRKLGEASSLGRSVLIRELPKLVRFRDIRDPRTVELVDPRDLAKSFGTQVKLKRIVLTIVDEPVTVGIDQRFSWWASYQKKRNFDGAAFDIIDPVSNNLAAQISTSEFKRGGTK